MQSDIFSKSIFKIEIVLIAIKDIESAQSNKKSLNENKCIEKK